MCLFNKNANLVKVKIIFLGQLSRTKWNSVREMPFSKTNYPIFIFTLNLMFLNCTPLVYFCK